MRSGAFPVSNGMNPAFLWLMISGTVVLGVFDVVQKKYLLRGINEQVLLTGTWLAGGIFLFAASLVFGIPEIRAGFWSAVFITVALNVVSQNVFIRAFKASDVSLVAPLRLLTPVFVLATGFIFLGEVPTFLGSSGIFLTILGLWLLLLADTAGVNAFFTRKLFHQKGVMLGIVGAILFAVSLPFDKKALLASSGLFAAAIVVLSVGVVTLILNIALNPSFRSAFAFDALKWKKELAAVALLNAAGGFLTLQALQYSLVAYGASLKRLWSFWAVVFAGQFLKEAHWKRRMLATLIMLLGIGITAVWG